MTANKNKSAFFKAFAISFCIFTAVIFSVLAVAYIDEQVRYIAYGDTASAICLDVDSQEGVLLRFFDYEWRCDIPQLPF